MAGKHFYCQQSTQSVEICALMQFKEPSRNNEANTIHRIEPRSLHIQLIREMLLSKHRAVEACTQRADDDHQMYVE